MKKFAFLAAVVVASLALAACNDETEVPVEEIPAEETAVVEPAPEPAPPAADPTVEPVTETAQ